MMAPTTAAALPTLDELLLAPLPAPPPDLRRAASDHRRYVRHLLIEVGHGRTSRLSRADRAVVLAQCHADYDRYAARRRLADQRPWTFYRYYYAWLGLQRMAWGAHDVPRRVRKFLAGEEDAHGPASVS